MTEDKTIGKMSFVHGMSKFPGSRVLFIYHLDPKLGFRFEGDTTLYRTQIIRETERVEGTKGGKSFVFIFVILSPRK